MLRLRWLTSLVAAATVIIGATQMAGPAQAADAWIQQGASIDGSATTELSGWSVAMSDDGTSVVVGSPYMGRDGNIHVGQVRVFTWDGIAWTQQGGSINGEAEGDLAGHSVAMSANGTTIAIGAPGRANNVGQVRVYTWDGIAWTQQGGNINGQAATDIAGWSVALSADGTSVAVGAPRSAPGGRRDAGQVRVFTWDGSAWTQRGVPIDGQTATDIAGWSVALSADGTSVAVGAPGRATDAGQVRVYSWNGSAWTQQGADINGDDANDLFGISVAMSGDGMTIAIGSVNSNGTAGLVRVLTWNGSAWTQQGADINGETAGDQSGFSVAVSATGTTVAVGAPYTDSNGTDAGQVRIFTWNGSAWTQQGADINGQAALDQSGYSVAISANGASVAIGAPVNTNAAVNAGQVRIFTWTAVNASVPGPLTYFTFLLPDGRECTSISPMRVEIGTMVELPGVNALCQTMPGSTVAGWTIPVPPGFTGAGSSSLPFNPGHRVRVIESQRFTLVPFDPIVQIEYDANIAAADNCTVVDVAHGSDEGRGAYAWVPRVDFAMARTATAAPCVPEGYELIGWNTRGDGSGTTIAPGAPLPNEWATGPVNDHHLYAQWSSLR